MMLKCIVKEVKHNKQKVLETESGNSSGKGLALGMFIRGYQGRCLIGMDTKSVIGTLGISNNCRCQR